MQEDPIAFAAGDENIHRYVGNDPVNAVDPTGLVSQEPPGGPGSPGDEADRHVNQQFESTGRTLSLDPKAAPRFARTWGRWLLGTPGDWLDRNYGGGQYGDPDLSGRILHIYSDLSTLAPILGEARDAVDVVVGIDAAGNRLTPTERGLTFAMLAIPIVPTRWVRGPAIDIIEGVVDHAPNRGRTPYRDPQRPNYNNGKIHKDHIQARSLDGPDTPSNIQDLAAETNLRKGGHEGALKRYEQDLIRNGMSPQDARKVIQSEIDSLGVSPPPRPMDPNILDQLPANPMDQGHPF